jgi:hypothetical protein
VTSAPRPEPPHDLDRVLREEGARVGYLISDAGMLSTSSGEASGVDRETFVSLVAAQASAARALAPLVTGREFSELSQEGVGATIRVMGLRDGWIVASLHDVSPGSTARPHSSGEQVAALQADLERIAGQARSRQSAGPGRVGEDWSDDAASRIDQIFGGGD